MTLRGLPERNPAEIDSLVGRIEACAIPRRKPRIVPAPRVRLTASDPLRCGIKDGVGAYPVRRLLHSLGFDEYRAMSWRMEHKLVQAAVFDRYVPGTWPRTWGLASLLRAIEPGSLRAALATALPEGVFIKRALDTCSGDRGGADSTRMILDDLERGVDLNSPSSRMADEAWIVQERIGIARELRVHSLENSVLKGFTFLRYQAGTVPDDASTVEDFVQSILDQFPDGLVGESLWGWDVAVDTQGRLRVIEVNLTGFHPIRGRGFQCSGYFHGLSIGPELVADLYAHAGEVYGVELEIPQAGPNELDGCRAFLDVLRHRVAARARHASAPRLSPCPPSKPEWIDAILYLNEQNVERFAILKRSLERFLGSLRTCWVATPDSQFASIAGRFASQRFEFLKESDVLPELKTWKPASSRCRVQAVMLALAMRRIEGNFVLCLTPDTICTRPVAMNDMLVDGRSRWSRSIDQVDAQFYKTAEQLLGFERSGFVYSGPPGVLSRAVLADLTAHLESRSHGDGRPSGSRWPSLLLSAGSWTLISLYFTFLDGRNLVHVHHAPAGLPFVGNPVWSEKVWVQWDPAAAFAPDAPYVFTIVRTGPGIPPEAVWDRVGPYISAATELPTSPQNVSLELQKGETRRAFPSELSTSMRP